MLPFLAATTVLRASMQAPVSERVLGIGVPTLEFRDLPFTLQPDARLRIIERLDMMSTAAGVEHYYLNIQRGARLADKFVIATEAERNLLTATAIAACCVQWVVESEDGTRSVRLALIETPQQLAEFAEAVNDIAPLVAGLSVAVTNDMSLTPPWREAIGAHTEPLRFRGGWTIALKANLLRTALMTALMPDPSDSFGRHSHHRAVALRNGEGETQAQRRADSLGTRL